MRSKFLSLPRLFCGLVRAAYLRKTDRHDRSQHRCRFLKPRNGFLERLRRFRSIGSPARRAYDDRDHLMVDPGNLCVADINRPIARWHRYNILFYVSDDMVATFARDTRHTVPMPKYLIITRRCSTRCASRWSDNRPPGCKPFRVTKAALPNVDRRAS